MRSGRFGCEPRALATLSPIADFWDRSRRSCVPLCAGVWRAPDWRSLGSVPANQSMDLRDRENKFVDGLRRRGYRADIPIENVIETLTVEEKEEGLDGYDLDRLLARLSGRQRDVVRSISIEGA
jgi:hypothetical protein